MIDVFSCFYGFIDNLQSQEALNLFGECLIKMMLLVVVVDYLNRELQR
jgi:hypothetical protein